VPLVVLVWSVGAIVEGANEKADGFPVLVSSEVELLRFFAGDIMSLSEAEGKAGGELSWVEAIAPNESAGAAIEPNTLNPEDSPSFLV
jgi:hypothetical protein